MNREFKRLRTSVVLCRLLPAYLLLALFKHIVPLKRLARWTWHSPGRARNREAERRLMASIIRLSRLIPLRDRDCLQRSLLLYRELSRAGADPTLVIGFLRGADRISGHAWVVVDGEPVIESAADLSRFSVALEFGWGGALLSMAPQLPVPDELTIQSVGNREVSYCAVEDSKSETSRQPPPDASADKALLAPPVLSRSKAISELMNPLNEFLRRFASFAGIRGVCALVLILLGAMVEGVGIVLLIPFLSVIIGSQNSGSWIQNTATRFFVSISAESRFAQLSSLIAIFALLMIVRASIVTLRDVTTAQLRIGFIQQLRMRITRLLAAAPWDTVSRLRFSRIVHLMGTDVQQLESATYILLRDAIAIVVLTTQVVIAFLLAPLLATFVIGLMLLSATILLFVVKRARDIGTFVTGANLSLLNDVSQFLGGLKLAISQNLQNSFIREFAASLENIKAQQIRYIRMQTLTGTAITTFSSLIGAFTVVLGVAVFDIPSPILITLLLLLARMGAPVMQLQMDVQQLAHSLPAYETIRELEIDLTNAEAAASPADSTVEFADGPIIFRGVSYMHTTEGGSGTAGIRDLDLIIEPGTVVGVTGPSGAGKTTFADLLVALYHPQKGAITAGGIALRGPAVASWRNSVSYIAQDPFLFHDTIRRNLLWARPEANEIALWDCLRIAGAEELVRKMAQGLDTLVGERGSLLSGGERQRLSFARAILRSPRLLVLDEATNAIDIEGEYALIARLLRVIPRPTILMISHRLETLRHCQRVLIFEEGRLISDGTPQAILASPSSVERLQRSSRSIENQLEVG